MDLSKLMLLCAVALGGLVVGCKSDCESACDEYKDCPSADSQTDCSKTCSQEQDAAGRMGCKSKLEDLSSCIAEVGDVCKLDLSTQCTRENDAFNACFANFCMAQPDAYDCKSYGSP
jgi:hypothetical protein